MKLFLRLARYSASYKGKLLLIFMFMALYTLFNGVSLATIIPLIDKVLGGKEITLTISSSIPFYDQIQSGVRWLNSIERYPHLLNLLVGFVCFALIIKEVSEYFQRILTETVGQSVIRDMRNTIFAHIQNLSMEYFSHQKTGILMSRVTMDVAQVAEIFSARFAAAVLEGGQLFVYAGLIFLVQWKLALGSLLVLSLLIFPITSFGRKIRKSAKRSQERIADMNAILQEAIFGIRIVKAFSMEEYETQKFKKENQKFFKMMVKVVRRSALLSPITQLAGIALTIFILYYLAREVIKGEMTVGFLMLFVGALLSCLRPVKLITRLSGSWQKASASLERIFNLLDVAPSVVESKNPFPLKDIHDKVSFKNVSFAYLEDDTVLKNVNLEARVGEIIAIVGPSGSGKSSLLNLLLRFYDPSSGSIEIDGVDIRNVSFKDLRALIGVVTQETILFNDTVRNNIAYGRIDATDEEIMHAAQLANSHEFIMQLPQQYDTLIGERGTKLSGGQKQRLSIARAVLKNPKILILDEATSALDTESERLVQGAMDNLMQARTVFVVAHRLSTIKHADRIMVLEKGEVVQIGHHGELIESEGLYKKLYELQFSI